MHRLKTHLLTLAPSRLLSALATCLLMLAVPALAQEANVLGLPAIPQAKPSAVAGSANPASAPKKPGATPAGTPASSPSRDVLAGEMGLQHSALDGLGRLIITTRATFATTGVQSNAIDAARAVQRDLGSACGKQCKPQKMTTPKILASGQLEFELAFRPLYQHLNQVQFVAALQSKPLNLTPAQLNAPVAASPAVSVTIATSTSTSPPPGTSAK